MKKISAKNTLIGMVLIPAMFSGAVLAHAAGIDQYDQDRSVKKPKLLRHQQYQQQRQPQRPRRRLHSQQMHYLISIVQH